MPYLFTAVSEAEREFSGMLIYWPIGIPYLFAAFCAVWIVLFLYLLSLSRRHRELSREVEALRQMMEQKNVSGSS